ncbi:MAG: S41 family peptidase [Nitrospinaceae bacterium]|nr:S41 family peptidase [Nitrospina sp.]MBT5869611.1 S41 family peptidase [Nitrospinaceae bacterium]
MKNQKNSFLKSLMGLVVAGVVLLYLPQVHIPWLTPLQGTADAGFFNNDLEVFEEVIDLVSEKYVYPPDHKKLFSAAIEAMIKEAGSKELTLSKNPGINTLRYKNRNTQYKLTYNKKHDWEEFQKIYYFLHDQSNSSISKENLETSAIEGIIESLDTYSQYMDRDTFEKSMRDTEGKYGGLGMVITMKDNRLFVVKTMQNSPAERAGIQAEDSFVSVNGKNISGLHIEELADLLRGYPNTKVTLTLLRPSEKAKQTYTLTRENILINTVEYETLDNRIGYLKISSFSKQTEKQLNAGLKQAKQDGVKGFVLDLRNNPGGLLTQSVKVSSHFLFKGRMVVYTQGREESDYHEYRGLYKNSLYQVPIVVLVNQYSASAAEIVTGALRDSGKALVIGENSYGKGSVQTIFRLSDGSGLRLTTSKYYTPSGIDITEQGIVPEIRVINDIAGDEVAKTGKTGLAQPSLKLKVSSLKKFFEKQNVALSTNHDATVELALRILKNTNVASKKRSMEKAREIAANINY